MFQFILTVHASSCVMGGLFWATSVQTEVTVLNGGDRGDDMWSPAQSIRELYSNPDIYVLHLKQHDNTNILESHENRC